MELGNMHLQACRIVNAIQSNPIQRNISNLMVKVTPILTRLKKKKIVSSITPSNDNLIDKKISVFLITKIPLIK
jgi:hypothetical protein